MDTRFNWHQIVFQSFIRLRFQVGVQGLTRVRQFSTFEG